MKIWNKCNSKIIMSLIIIIFLVAINTGTTIRTEIEKGKSPELNDKISLENKWSKWNRDQDHNKLDDLLDEKILAGEDESVNIYINYRAQPTRSDIQKLNELCIEISYAAKYIPTVCARSVPLDKIKQLNKLPNIAMIELQPYLVHALDVSARSVKARESMEYSPNTAWELGYTGRGVVIAILDSGVDDRHESLENKYIAGYDTTASIGKTRNPDDEDGHGTHVAGIAMGTGGEDGQFIGVAPNARLIDVKVLSDWGLTPGDNVIEGIEWCIDNKDNYGINILSLSVGELFIGDDNGQGTQGQLVNTASATGLAVVVAAGNDGERGFSSLAAADSAITVGSISIDSTEEEETVIRTDDEISDFSNYGPRANDLDEDKLDELKPDVVAPGEDIMSALFSASPAGILTGYHQMSGTSMACPHVSGLVALMLEANPNLSPEKIKEILRDTSEARDDPTHTHLDPNYNKYYGWGIIDAYSAVKMALEEENQMVYFLSHQDYDEAYNVISIYGSTSVPEGEVELVEYRLAGEYWQPAQGTDEWEFKLDTTTLDNGLNIIQVRSYNGIEYSSEFELILDVVNIGAGYQTPTNGSTVSGKVEISGDGFGSEELTILLKIGNDDWIPIEPEMKGDSARWKHIWDTTNYDNGKYILTLKAYNGEWYSVPISIEVTVKNEKKESAGFLPGFNTIMILVSILLLLIYYRKNEQYKI